MKSCFCTDTPGSIEWLDPAPRLHIDDCFEIRNCRLGPCDLLLSNHQKFLHEVRLRQCVFCTGPCGPLIDLAISVFREVNINTVCSPKSTLLAGAKALKIRNSVIHEIIAEFLSFRSVLWSSFSLGFEFLVDLVNGSHRSFRSTCEFETSVDLRNAIEFGSSVRGQELVKSRKLVAVLWSRVSPDPQ